MGQPDLFVGIDGGGSRTRAVIVDARGQVLGRGTAGSANHDDVGPQVMQQNLKLAITQAAQQAAVPCHFHAIHCGLAGIISEEDAAVVRQAVEGLHYTKTIGVTHDLQTALEGGALGQHAIVIVSGTGSAAYGCNAAGISLRVGGWGHLLADDGSGYALALSALRAALRGVDGLGPETALLPTALAFLDIDDVNHIMYRVYAQGISRKELATFAPQVVAAAEAGDPVANELVDQHSAALASLVQTAARRLAMDAPDVLPFGSLISAETLYRTRFSENLVEMIPAARIRPPQLSAELGAALLAMKAAGQSPSTAVWQTMLQSTL